jgi:choline-sulfatase
VCTASRQSFLTGRYPRSLGVTQLKTALPAGTPTLASLLKDAGYETASLGKMHFNSNLKHGFDLRIDQPDFRKVLQMRNPEPLPPNVEVQPQWKPFKDPARIWLNSANRPVAARDADMPGTYFTEQAEAFLNAKHEKPYFLMVSFYEPHSPFHYPVEFRGQVDPKPIPVPKVGSEDDWQIPAIFRDLTDDEKRGITAAYYTSVQYLDRNIGRVLAALKKSGQEQNTMIVLTGDHGYMLGHHGRFEKHCSFEPAIRAPLFVVSPKLTKPSTASSALVEFIDIAPTILETAGVPVPASIQGKSLTKLLRGDATQHRERVFVEYSENEEALVRDDRWKLVYTTGARQREDGYQTGKPLPGRKVLLFDTQTDPEEMINLAEKPEHAERVKVMTLQLADHLKRTAREPNLIPKTEDVHALLAHCLQPRDVPNPQPKK